MAPKKNIEIRHVEFTSAEDEVEPPPMGFVFRFASMREWLNHICTTEIPPQKINSYIFSLFETDSEYIVSLAGVYTYHKSVSYSVREIVFKPDDMYFLLSQQQYKNLTRQAMLQLLTDQLKKFVTSETFRKLFFCSAAFITTNWTGIIWTNAIS